MAHAMNRTLLASLGFADSDRAGGLHDMASQYCLETDVLVSILEAWWSLCSNCTYGLRRDIKRKTEVPVNKGEGQYKNTIGFLDATAEMDIVRECQKEANHNNDWNGLTIAFEVKIKCPSIGEVVRQLALYREYFRASLWVLATVDELSDFDLSVLDQAKIKHILLGEKFQEYVIERRKALTDSDLSAPENPRSVSFGPAVNKLGLVMDTKREVERVDGLE